MELSIRGYARHRGVAESAVRKAIAQGRITKGKNGKINPKIADKEWGQNSDPAQIRAIKEAYGAKLLRLQFEKESKKLISIDDVKVSAFNAARMTRDRILNIPDRVIPQLVGKTNIFEMKEILKAELIKALEELSKVNDKL